MLVFKKPCGPNATPNLPSATPYTSNAITYLPNTTPMRGDGIKVALGPLVLGLALAMYIIYFLCHFYSRWVANAISGGIWALKYAHIELHPDLPTLSLRPESSTCYLDTSIGQATLCDEMDHFPAIFNNTKISSIRDTHLNSSLGPVYFNLR